MTVPGRSISDHPLLETRRDVLRHYLGDLVYGANDGIITTFAIVAGVAGADLPGAVVIILGVANLIADGFSMGASNFLSLRSKATMERIHVGRVSEPFALRHGLATFLAFVTIGVIPLLGYILPFRGDPFVVASVMTLSAMFVVGASRSFVSGGRWWSEGAEMLAVGATAAAVAFGLGRLVAALTGYAP
ncbi:MAG TPA: VIT1/CCC1 transporter family protein [Longimicrobiales bacterium]|nr:VIT1/CCC1 transporter family protein [Longimicrobiales bacterium]